MWMVFVFFFFSSRRRHTRFDCDWSSDVCSSDLREVVFVDIALAQIAALGATAAFLAGYETDTWESYVSGLSATLLGALVLSLTRSRRRHVSQEAVIGVVYAVSSAAAVLLSDRAAHGAEQVRTMLVGNLLA